MEFQFVLLQVLLVMPPLNRCWSPPKSKETSQDTDEDADCREIWEEVGLEIEPRVLTRFAQKLQVNFENKHFASRMYFCEPLCLNTHFAPGLNMEIGYISWFRIDELCTPEKALTTSGFECDEKAWQNLHVFLDEIKAEADEIKARHIDHPGCGSTDFCIPVHDVGLLPDQDLVGLHPNQQNQQLVGLHPNQQLASLLLFNPTISDDFLLSLGTFVVIILLHVLCAVYGPFSPTNLVLWFKYKR